MTDIVGIMPVHVGGMMMDLKALSEFAEAHDLWIVEDAAHAFPAAWRARESDPWVQCGQSGGLGAERMADRWKTEIEGSFAFRSTPTRR